MNRELTDRQAEVLDFIGRFMKDNGYPPTLLDICEDFGWASNHSAWLHVVALRDKGYLSKVSQTARGLRLTGRHP